MHALTIPELNAPFPSRIHPCVQDIYKQTALWVKKFRLHQGPAFARYRKEGLSWMTARFYPTAPQNRLQVTDKFNTLLFAMDDLMDHNDHRSAVISSRASFEAFIDLCMQIMEGQRLNLPGTGHLAALADVWAEVTALSSAGWQQRFRSGIRQMFDAALWAHDNVAAGRMPTIRAFYRMRPFLGAANTSTDMIEFTEGVKLSPVMLQHPVVAELTRLCQITVCLANDLFSLSKEMAHADKHNMVLITQREKGCSLQAAIRETVRIHNSDVARFIKLSGQLPVSSEDLGGYVVCLSALMRGNIDWSLGETNRYHFSYAGKQVKALTIGA